MKQTTVQIIDNSSYPFMKNAKNFSFIKKTDKEIEPNKEQILKGIESAIHEIKQIKAGKKEATSLLDFLNGL